jgi:cation transport regulator ChaC
MVTVNGYLSPQVSSDDPTFYYFAYGSCMCPVDLRRTLGESTHHYVVGTAHLKGYRLGFNRRSHHRNCGVLDIVLDAHSQVEGVLYQLPWRLSDRRETIAVHCGDRHHTNVRTYVVVNKLSQELAPNDWYFDVVMRGATTCGLSEEYCWRLFDWMHRLQQQQRSTDLVQFD